MLLKAGKLPAEVSCRRLAEGMIRVSDNTATNLLISRLGMDRIGALAQEFGLRHTALRRRMMDLGALARAGEHHLCVGHGQLAG